MYTSAGSRSNSIPVHNGNQLLPHNCARKACRYTQVNLYHIPLLYPIIEIPSKETLLESMVPILEESKKWPLGSKYEEKGYGTTIQTFSRNKTARDHAMWHGRVSEHSKESIGGFEPFWDGLGHNHTLNEKEYALLIHGFYFFYSPHSDISTSWMKLS